MKNHRQTIREAEEDNSLRRSQRSCLLAVGILFLRLGSIRHLHIAATIAAILSSLFDLFNLQVQPLHQQLHSLELMEGNQSATVSDNSCFQDLDGLSRYEFEKTVNVRRSTAVAFISGRVGERRFLADALGSFKIARDGLNKSWDQTTISQCRSTRGDRNNRRSQRQDDIDKFQHPLFLLVLRDLRGGRFCVRGICCHGFVGIHRFWSISTIAVISSCLGRIRVH